MAKLKRGLQGRHAPLALPPLYPPLNSSADFRGPESGRKYVHSPHISCPQAAECMTVEALNCDGKTKSNFWALVMCDINKKIFSPMAVTIFSLSCNFKIGDMSKLNATLLITLQRMFQCQPRSYVNWKEVQIWCRGSWWQLRTVHSAGCESSEILRWADNYRPSIWYSW